MERSRSITGCGAAGNPKNRFERIEIEPVIPEGGPHPETFYLRDHIVQLFELSCRRAGIERVLSPKLSTAAFRRARKGQQSLFD